VIRNEEKVPKSIVRCYTGQEDCLPDETHKVKRHRAAGEERSGN
jgi:hypothetical protein